LSTLHREYAALMGLPYYDLIESVLRPRLSKIANVDPKEIKQVMTTYNVNEPQALAILSTLKTDGFALIQG
jgi:senataxin